MYVKVVKKLIGKIKLLEKHCLTFFEVFSFDY